jgi:prepilin-type N-terminal cleavage/methylation domain-containing protein
MEKPKRFSFLRQIRPRKGFTLIELLIVIAVIGILVVVVLLLINPAEYLRRGRDSNRLSDFNTFKAAMGLASLEGINLGAASTTYVSIPDPAVTSTAGDQCQSLSLPTLPSGWVYHCAGSNTFRKVDGTGWNPVNLKSLSTGSPVGSLPVDPINSVASYQYYTYAAKGVSWEITSQLESTKYIPNEATDGGLDPAMYEVGNDFAVSPFAHGMVGYWTFDEGAGTTANDSSGYGNTGTLQNAPTWTSGPTGDALTFNGTNQYVLVPEVPLFEISTSWTVSAWFQLTSLPASGNFYSIVSRDDSNGDSNYNLIVDNGHFGAGSGVVVNFNPTSGGNQYAKYVTALSTGVWYHLSGIYDSSAQTLTLYLNGSNVTRASVAGFSPDTGSGPGLGIATEDGSFPAQYFPGTIDDVRIYNRALSDSEALNVSK